MRAQRRLHIIIAAAVCGLIAFIAWPKNLQRATPSAGAPEASRNKTSPPSASSASAPTCRVDPAQVRIAESFADGISHLPESHELVAGLNQPQGTPEQDLEIVGNLLATYHAIFGSNPPGGYNREIVTAMLGANTRKLAILPRNLTALSPTGELLDRWGTPFFFHPVSNEIMEVMSAGPDQTLWTPDDVGNITPAGDHP